MRFAASRAVLAPAVELGGIVLRPDQVDTTRSVLALVRRAGGCLLADDVGTGKTYVALAVAREWSRPLIVVPASLRVTWARAIARASIDCAMVSHESLSRGAMPSEPFDFIVVDESHRFRPTSCRHAVLARLAAHAPLLLLSATPQQNRTRELAAQLALFLGETAYQMNGAQLTRWIVRGTARADVAFPRVAPPRWLDVNADDEAVLRALLALPPPPRPADAGDGGALLVISLVRAWASTRAALVATVQRRRRTLLAIEQCHAEGRLPTRGELKSWRAGVDVQLGFPTLLADLAIDTSSLAMLAASIAAERDALDALMRTIERGADPDPARVAALESVRSAHADASILAFSESASTVRAYFAALRARPGVGMLTASEARIASGRVARDELLALFAPRAQGARTPAAHERVTLLLATDLLSEGVNLQDASVVVHLDLPWNPARLAQRLGRVRRPGGAPEVTSYLMTPPASAAMLLRAEERLRAKLASAERTIGRGLDVMPMLRAGRDVLSPSEASTGVEVPRLASAELRGEIERVLARWRLGSSCHSASREMACVVVAASSTERGWVAVLDDGRLVACRHSEVTRATPSEEPADVLHALTQGDGCARALDVNEQATAQRQLAHWLACEWTVRSSGLAALDSRVRRRALHAIDSAVRDVRRHRRQAALSSAARLRAALERPLPLGVERALDELIAEHEASPSMSRTDRQEQWLERATALVANGPAAKRTVDAGTRAPALTALILYGPA